MILVTGGAGYLGSVLTDWFESIGERYSVLDNLTYADDYLINKPFAYCDVRQMEYLKPWLDKADCVVWLAALVGDAVCEQHPVAAHQINEEAVEALAQNYDGPIVYTSSCSVYGASRLLMDERSPVQPLSIYAETKVAAERALKDKNALILRLGTLHGFSPRMRFDLFINRMTECAVRKKRIQVVGGNQQRPVLSVWEAAYSIGNAAIKPDWKPGIYNLARENVTVREAAERVARALGGEAEIVTTHVQTEDRRNYAVKLGTNDLLVSDYEFSIEGTAREVSDVLTSGRILNPFLDKYENAKAVQAWKVDRD